jgi:hypothetical protein
MVLACRGAQRSRGAASRQRVFACRGRLRSRLGWRLDDHQRRAVFGSCHQEPRLRRGARQPSRRASRPAAEARGAPAAARAGALALRAGPAAAGARGAAATRARHRAQPPAARAWARCWARGARVWAGMLAARAWSAAARCSCVGVASRVCAAMQARGARRDGAAQACVRAWLTRRDGHAPASAHAEAAAAQRAVQLDRQQRGAAPAFVAAALGCGGRSRRLLLRPEH